MIPPFQPNGYLPPGIHPATWQQTVERLGTNPHRRTLLRGLLLALENLRQAGCRTIYLNGSFASAEVHPGDFDVAWETINVDPRLEDSPMIENEEQYRVTRERERTFSLLVERMESGAAQSITRRGPGHTPCKNGRDSKHLAGAPRGTPGLGVQVPNPAQLTPDKLRSRNIRGCRPTPNRRPAPSASARRWRRLRPSSSPGLRRTATAAPSCPASPARQNRLPATTGSWNPHIMRRGVKASITRRNRSLPSSSRSA